MHLIHKNMTIILSITSELLLASITLLKYYTIILYHNWYKNIPTNLKTISLGIIITIYFLIFTLWTANYRLLGEKVSLFPLSSKGGGGALIAGGKVLFSPPMSCVLLKYVLFPPMLSKTLKNNSLWNTPCVNVWIKLYVLSNTYGN